MAAIATLALNNGATSVNFTPAAVLNNIAEWEYTGASSYYDGRHTVTLSVAKSAKSKVARVKGTITIPLMDSTFESQQKGVCRVDFTAIVPKVSLANERAVAANIFKSFVASTPVQAALTDLTPTY